MERSPWYYAHVTHFSYLIEYSPGLNFILQNLLGIEFIPWNEPFHRRMEALAVGAYFVTVTAGGYILLLFSIYLLFTPLCWLILPYLLWIYLDRNTCETGGRSNKWVQTWSWWYYHRQYFPAHLKLSPNLKLNSERNYLFCCFPHGVIPMGPGASLAWGVSDFHHVYPEFAVKTAVLKQLCYLPITRELLLSLGGISPSAKSIQHVLSKPEGGNILILFPGGATEASYAQPGVYKFVVKKRKGFIKLALKSGAPLVPVITFGECDTYGQITGPIFKRIQMFVKKVVGFVPFLLVGNGLFQKTFGLIPRRKPLTTVVGAPINFERNKEPTDEDIEKLHQVFIEELNLLGIEFIPWNEPFHRRIEALAVGAYFVTVTAAGYILLLFSIYLLFTPLWWLILPYLLWIYLDRNTCETGGRSNKWVQNWSWWSYYRQYFPAHLKLSPNLNLNSKRNYLFCCFPHGVLPMGIGPSLAWGVSDFHHLYPEFAVKTAALKQLFFLPITRELFLSMGGVSPSAKSIQHVLCKPEGGNILILVPGGAAESFYAQPGVYKFVVKKRKGFIKLALKSGAPLVPVITFGECDTYGQITGPIFKRIQMFVKKVVGFVPFLLVGNGLFQKTFGLIPRRKPLTTVVGAPINFERNKEPTDEDIEKLHQVFIEELVRLFETYKYEYLENPEEQQLELK